MLFMQQTHWQKSVRSFAAGSRKIGTLFLVFTTILWALGVPISSLVPVLPVPSALAVSGVLAADQDITGYALDGRDFSITWTPGTEPAGYAGTKIFILPNATTVAANTVLVNACGGSACSERGFLGQSQQNTFVLPQFFTTDSASTAWNAGTSYKACVFTDATSDTLDCSSAFSVVSDTSVVDTNAPIIDHMSVNSVVGGGSDATIYAIVRDDQTTASQFANTGDAGVEYIKLYYGTDVSVSESAINATLVEGNLFLFTISSPPPETIGSTIEYYLTARDSTAGTPGNVRYFCANPSAANATDCKAAPFVSTVVAAGSRTVQGTVRYNTPAGAQVLPGAKVFAAGYPSAAATTDGSGNYTIASLPNNNAFDFTAYKAGYCANRRFETIGTANKTGVDINLNIGECGFAPPGGEGGDGTPHVIFSGPPDGSNMVPLTEKIRVGLNTAMSATTVNDLDASAGSNNIYLTTDDGTTKIAGSVLWCANQAAQGCSTLPSMDTNTILFSSTSNLTANTFYTLVITEAVISESGQSIQGNRPAGGHKVSFSTGGAAFDAGTISTNFGSGGQYLPPFVKSTVPAPGMAVRPNSKILVEFNEQMNTSTLATTNIKLAKMSNGTPTYQTVTLNVDSNESRFITINHSDLVAGDYEIQVLGAVANAKGMTMRSPAEATSVAFRNNFMVSGANDATGPTVYPMLANNATGVAVNVGAFQFGFNEQLNFSTVSSTNITLQRGTTSVDITTMYDPGENTVFVTPNTVLAPNTVYVVNIGTGVTDLAGIPLSSAATYSYTTGNADTVVPALKEARCDDYKCYIVFTEPMNHDTQADSNYADSVLKNANWTIQRTAPDVATIDITGKPINYDAKNYSATIEGVAGLAASNSFRVTANAAIKDLSSNAIDTTNSANIFNGKVENSQATFGSFGDMGMFGPPVTGVGAMNTAGGGAFTGTIGGEFKPEGFGGFTASQFAFGQADTAYPFASMASQDSNVFQVRLNPGVALVDDDLVVLTFPTGTTLTSAAPDTLSPFFTDINESTGAGTVAYDVTYDTDGVAVDTTARTVTVKLAVSGGTPGANDHYVFDLRKIINPAVPKGPETGGYTVGIKVSRAGEILVNKTSTPYFIQAGGTRSITVKIYAGSTAGVAGANGNVSMFAGGPGGPMNKTMTLTNGKTTAADGTVIAGDAGLVYSNLPDGCYGFGTEPYVALGGVDYYGQMSPEPVCVNSATPDVTKNIILTAASGAGTVNVTVKLAGIADFGGVDVDIFAGGPGRFVTKTLSALGAPADAGYTLTLNANGPWNIGVGPAMSRGTSMSMPKALPGISPPPTDIMVSGLPSTGAIAAGFRTPPGVSVNTAAKIITFTFSAADKIVSGTVNDGTTGLANVNVFMHAQGFGQPAFTTTKTDGTFSLSVADYGSYEIGVMKDGLPPVMNNIEIRPDGEDVGTAPDIFYKGKQIVAATNPLVIKLKKPSYTISGKVLDANSNAIAYAPVFATDANGNSANGGTSSDGSYTIFVDAGTWTVKSMMPPDKTDTCGTFEKTVIVSTESKSSQNISPSTSTCYTLSGTVTVAGTPLANVPIFVDEWDTTNSRPVAGGMFRPSNTNSSGVYSVKVKGSTTYHVGTWDPTYGELSVTQAITTADVTNAHINSGATGTATLAFTGGSASHEAFIELKKSDDKFTRVSKTQKGLASNVAFTLKEGTYNYSVDVFGVGKYSGTVATGATATIDLSGITLVTLSGNVNDNSGVDISGALVSVKASDGTVKTTTTDASGNYSLSVKSGTYTVSSSKAQYMAGQASASVAVAVDTANYDFGGASPDQTALKKSDQVITGTVYQSDGVTKATDGFVTAADANGTTVSATIDPVTGVYSLPVDDGTWTIKGVAPLHAKTTLSGSVTTAGTTDQTGKDITLTADATKTSTSTSASLSASSGGSVNDTQNTGVKLTVGQGVLETGNTTVSLDMEKTFTAPDSETFRPLGNAAFSITAQNSESASTIKDLKGNAEIQIDYTSLLSSLPSGTSEANLKLAYYSTEKGAYVPVEGGYTVDAANNTVTGQVNHFTNFALVYIASVSGGLQSDLTPPAPPTNVALTSTSSSVTITWNDPGDSDLNRIEILRNNGGSTPVSGVAYAYVNKGVGTYTDTAVNVGVTYKYQLQARDTANNPALTAEYTKTVSAVTVVPGGGSPGGGASTPSTLITPTTPTTTTPTTTTTTTETTAPAATAAPVAVLIKDPSKLDDILSGLSVARNQSDEAKYMPLVKSDAIAFKVGLSEEQQTALTNFVSYGISEKTKALGSGERRALVRDYLETVGRANVNWEDMERMTKGEKPVSRNLAKEQAKVGSVLQVFKKLVGHTPNFQDVKEDIAWNTLMYRIRFTRDLDKEKAGIAEFRAIFKRLPKSPLDWSAVRALGYALGE